MYVVNMSNLLNTPLAWFFLKSTSTNSLVTTVSTYHRKILGHFGTPGQYGPYWLGSQNRLPSRFWHFWAPARLQHPPDPYIKKTGFFRWLKRAKRKIPKKLHFGDIWLQSAPAGHYGHFRKAKIWLNEKEAPHLKSGSGPYIGNLIFPRCQWIEKRF